LNEIELTGQAYDDMQEQNDRLLQQLSSKDDANFKLITDRINASQKQALLTAQIKDLEKQVNMLLFYSFTKKHYRFCFFFLF
jgi:E3 ubiquitin-protein ligase BRE1